MDIESLYKIIVLSIFAQPHIVSNDSKHIDLVFMVNSDILFFSAHIVKFAYYLESLRVVKTTELEVYLSKLFYSKRKTVQDTNSKRQSLLAFFLLSHLCHSRWENLSVVYYALLDSPHLSDLYTLACSQFVNDLTRLFCQIWMLFLFEQHVHLLDKFIGGRILKRK